MVGMEASYAFSFFEKILKEDLGLSDELEMSEENGISQRTQGRAGAVIMGQSVYSNLPWKA